MAFDYNIQIVLETMIETMMVVRLDIRKFLVKVLGGDKAEWRGLIVRLMQRRRHLELA